MTYLLDTNVVSAMRRRDRLPRGARLWLQERYVGDFHVSALTMMEIEIGIQRLERHDRQQGAMLRAWTDGVLRRQFRGRILDVDVEVCERCAALHVPDPKPEVDSLIAATAIVHRLTIVTRNEADFAGMPVEVVNPWAIPAG